MTTKELIDVLTPLPPEAPVGLLWDGAVRSNADGAYLSQGGVVVIGPDWEMAYDDEDRPVGAPTEKEDPFFNPIKTT